MESENEEFKDKLFRRRGEHADSSPIGNCNDLLLRWKQRTNELPNNNGMR